MLLVLGALALLSVSAAGLTEAGKELQKYDINEDGSITISEVTALLNYPSSSCGHEAFTSIENYAFSSCNKLTSIVFNDTTTWYCTPSYSDWVSKSGGTPMTVTSALTNVNYFYSTYCAYY